MMHICYQCVVLLVVANIAAKTMAVVDRSCRVSLSTVGDTAVMTFPILAEVSRSTSPVYAYVKREKDTADVANCVRKQSESEIKCSVINPKVQSRGIVNNSLTLVFPNATLGMQGVYKLSVHFNDSWDKVDCELIVKDDVIKAEKNTKDGTTMIVVGVVVSLVIVAVIIIALLCNRVKIRRFCNGKFPSTVRLRHQNKTLDPPQVQEDPEVQPEAVMLTGQCSQSATAEDKDRWHENEKPDQSTEPLLTTQPDGNPPEGTSDPELEQFVEDQKKALASAGEFLTSSGLRVSVFRADITKLRVDCLVNAVDEKLSCSGGVSRAIQNAARTRLLDDLQQQVKDNGPAAVTEVFVTVGGELECTNVLHAVGPRWGDYKDTDKGLCAEHLSDTIYNCLVRACELGLTSIAFPAVSSGSFGVPLDIAARSYRNAVQRFGQRGPTGSLKHIYFVDTKQTVILAVRESFGEVHKHCDQGKNTVRVLLLGQIGAGKSALGNNLLRKPGTFLSRRGFFVVTKKIELGTTFLPEHGIELQVVDTPGLINASITAAQYIDKELAQSLSVLFPGPHVVLLVFECKCFTPTEEFIVTQIQELFPGVHEYMIVVFTNVDNDAELNEMLDNAESKFKELVDDCGGRTAGINNVGSSPFDLERQVDVLTAKIVDMYKANKGRSYSNEVILRCLQLMTSSEYTDKSLDEIRREVVA